MTKSVDPGARVVTALHVSKGCLPARILRGAVVRGRGRDIVRIALEISAIEMIERRGGHQQPLIESVHPGKRNKGVAFLVHVAKEIARDIVRISRIEWHLIEIAPQRSYPSQLVLRSQVVNQR